MTRYRDPAKLDDPQWPQTGLRVGETDDHRRTFWIRRVATQGRTVYWRVLEYLDEALTHSQDYRTLIRAKVEANALREYWNASLHWNRTDGPGQ